MDGQRVHYSVCISFTLRFSYLKDPLFLFCIFECRVNCLINTLLFYLNRILDYAYYKSLKGYF